MLKRKPGELLKLISRLGSLDSDDYKGKIADLYPKLVKGPRVMKASYSQKRCPFQDQKTKQEILEAGVISRV